MKIIIPILYCHNRTFPIALQEWKAVHRPYFIVILQILFEVAQTCGINFLIELVQTVILIILVLYFCFLVVVFKNIIYSFGCLSLLVNESGIGLS